MSVIAAIEQQDNKPESDEFAHLIKNSGYLNKTTNYLC